MGGLDPAKVLMLLAVALVLVGPERIPRAARQLGALWREIMKFRERMEEQVREALPDLDLPKLPAIPRGGLTGYLTGMMAEAERATRGDIGADGQDLGSGELDGTAAAFAAASATRTAAGSRERFGSAGGERPVIPETAPEAVLGAEVLLDLSDPSWN